jgi:hypothetical protein
MLADLRFHLSRRDAILRATPQSYARRQGRSWHHYQAASAKVPGKGARREEADLEEARVAVAWEWTRRLADLLEEDPRVEADLRAVGSKSGQRGLPTL